MARLQSVSFETATTISTVSSSSITENLSTNNAPTGTVVKGSNTSGNSLAIYFGSPQNNDAYSNYQNFLDNWKTATIMKTISSGLSGEVFIFNIGGNRYTVNIPDTTDVSYIDNWTDDFKNDILAGTAVTVAENTDGLSEGDAVTSNEYGTSLTVTITPPISVTTDSYEITGSLTVTGNSTIIPPTSDPGVSGALWNNSGTLSISAG
jgi:hypothetical protein